MGAHLIDGEFQSDKYPTCPPGKVPLSVKDPDAQDLLWEYSQRHRKRDPEFSDDLEQALRNVGYVPSDGSTEVAISQIGKQIRAAESARNHIEHGALGEHIDVLFGALSKLSG